MRPGRPNIYLALKDYVKAAIELLAERCPPNSVPTSQGAIWVRAGPDTFARQQQRRPVWADCVDRHRDDLHALAEFRKCEAVIGEDPDVTRQLNTMVGTVETTVRVAADDLTDGTLIHVLAETGDAHFDDSRFDAVYRRREAFFVESKLSRNVIAPLDGFHLDSAPIQLGADGVIDRLTDWETAACLDAGLIRSSLGHRPIARVPSFCLRVSHSLPKVIGEPTNDQVKQYRNLEAKTADFIERSVNALRLLKEGDFTILGHLVFSRTVFTERWLTNRTAPPRVSTSGVPFTLNEAEGRELAQLWSSMSSEGARKSRYLDVAIRRFSYVGERARLDDQIADLIIAAEALFLSGVGDERTRGELRYRLAMRAASFIPSQQWTKPQLFQLFGWAYDARSSVVHGSTPTDLRLPDGAAVDLASFVRLIQGEMRAAIRKMVTMASSLNRKLVLDWEANLLGGDADTANSSL